MQHLLLSNDESLRTPSLAWQDEGAHVLISESRRKKESEETSVASVQIRFKREGIGKKRYSP